MCLLHSRSSHGSTTGGMSVSASLTQNHFIQAVACALTSVSKWRQPRLSMRGAFGSLEAEMQADGTASFNGSHMCVKTMLCSPSHGCTSWCCKVILACAKCSDAARCASTEQICSLTYAPVPVKQQSGHHVLPVSIMPLYRSLLTSTSHFPTLSSIISAHGQNSVGVAASVK